MFETLGRVVVRRRRWVLALFGVTVVIAGVLGSGVFTRLGGSGFEDPGSDSARVATAMQDRFGVSDPAVVLAVNRRRAQILAQHREVDPWAGLGGSSADEGADASAGDQPPQAPGDADPWRDLPPVTGCPAGPSARPTPPSRPRRPPRPRGRGA